eukprot:15740618-Heterocapsa_arctica.AAC.1
MSMIVKPTTQRRAAVKRSSSDRHVPGKDWLGTTSKHVLPGCTHVASTAECCCPRKHRLELPETTSWDVVAELQAGTAWSHGGN